MSKLLNALEARFNGDRKALISHPIAIVSEKYTDTPYDNINLGYEIEAKFLIYGSCQRKDLDLMHKNAFNQLKIEIYGDLQKRVIELERQIFDETMPSESLRGMINDIKTEIF